MERWRKAQPLALAVLLAGLARLDRVTALVPFLGVLRGPLGLVLLVLGAAVALARIVPPPELPLPGRFTMVLVSGGLYLAVGQHYASGLRVSGDEPHYLLMAQSLWREGDLDLRDNYAREDWRENTPGPVSPHWGAPRSDGRPFPAHSPGLPLLLAPVYALGGRLACVALLGCLAAWLTLEVRTLALQLSGDVNAAFVAWTVAAGPPVAVYSFHVYTEIPSALALALGLRLLLSAPGPWPAAAAALATAALPWLHLKMVPAAAALGVVALARLRGRALAAYGAVAAVLAAAFLGFYQGIFGRPTPLAVYGGGLPQGDVGGSPVTALAGLLLDRSFGLLPHAPVVLLAFAGVLWLSKRDVPWPHLLVGVAVLAPVLTWRMWWGGQCPPARFLVPLVPLFGVVAAARAVAVPGRGLLRWHAALVALALALLLYVTADPGELLLLNRGDRPTRLWTALAGEGGQVGEYLPSLVAHTAGDWRVAGVWLGALGALLVLDRLAARRDAVDRWFGGLGLPAALLALVGLAIDLWGR